MSGRKAKQERRQQNRQPEQAQSSRRDFFGLMAAATTLAFGSTAWRDDAEPMPVLQRRISQKGATDPAPRQFSAEYIRKAVNEYRKLSAAIFSKRNEAHKAGKPFYIVLGTNHYIPDSLYDSLITLETARSLGINRLFGEFSNFDLQMTKLAAAGEAQLDERVPDRAFIADVAEQIGMSFRPIDTFYTPEVQKKRNRALT